LPLYLAFFSQRGAMWITMAVLVMLCGIGVTALYHRHYSHRTYRMSKAVEIAGLFFGTLATQGSALRWSHDHRLHHRHVDTDRDPYSINRGFWHAHFIWMLRKREAVDPNVVHDLMENKLVRFQDKYYVLLLALTNAAVIAFFGWLFNDYVGAFVVLFLARLFINHHTTWFINSLAHTWGVQPYSREHSAVNNWIISLLTYGEGYHNYHHTFAGDYRNGTRWYQFDPTKILIWGLSKLGLARDLRKVDKTIIARTLLNEDRKLVLERARQVPYVRLDAVERDVNTRADALLHKLAELSALVREYKELKHRRAKAQARKLRLRLKQLKKSIRVELRAWSRYCDGILRLKPQLA
jgi:stearoyl-CoA desaturase (delta-9 desaturase)